MKIAFISSNGWQSKIIKWFTKSSWTHCLIVLDDDLEGEALVFESSLTGGVKLNLWSRYNHSNKQVYDIRGTPSIKPLYQYLGKNYGYMQIIGYPLAKLFGLKRNPITKDYVCSEIVLRFLKQNDFKEFELLEPNSTTPEDLYKIVSVSKNFRVVNR